MKKSILLLSLMLWHGAAFCDDFSPVERTYASLLLSGDTDLVTISAESIHAHGNSNPRLLDIVAELMWSNIDGGVAKEWPFKFGRSDEDAVAWLAKTLGASQSGRYRDILRQSFDQTESEKLKKYIREAHNSLGEYDGESYQAGMVSLEEVQQYLDNYEGESLRQGGGEAFAEIGYGSTLEEVHIHGGQPNGFSVGFRNVRHFGGVVVSHPILRTHYFDYGILEFDLAKSKDEHHRVTQILKPIDPRAVFSDEDELGVLKQSLMIQGSPIVRHTSRVIYRDRMYDTDILDVMAERIYQSGAKPDKELEDGIAFMFKTIGASANPRYRSVTQYTLKNSKSRKIKKFAKSAMEALDEGDVPQYQKGGICSETPVTGSI